MPRSSPSPAPPRRLALIALALALAVAALVLWRLTRPPREVALEATAIAARLRVARARPHTRRDTIETATQRFYGGRGDRPAWTDGHRPGAAAFACAHALADAAREGLEPADYGAAALSRDCERLLEAWPAPPPESLGAFDVRMTRAFLRYARDARDGRLPPEVLDPRWVKERPRHDPVRDLGAALGTGRTAEVMAGLGPADPDSRALRAALGRLLDIAARGDWPRLPAGVTLRRGDAVAAVAALRRRLAYEDVVDTLGAPPRYDAALERAVRAFQVRHRLRATGEVDAATRAALAVPAAERARTLAMNLERRRWLTFPLVEPYLLVNLPDYSLELRDSARTVLAMRVVVGQKVNPTPVFSSAISTLEFNPVWRIPRRIVVDELVPAMRRDTSYLTRGHMRVYFTHAPRLIEVPHATVPWATAESDSFPYLVVQDSGPENPLGRIKFMFPNPYDVYLHDTSQHGLFGALDRARSHGCVRVEQPHALAERLLAPRWGAATGDSIDSLVARAADRHVGLPQKLAVHLLYWTAWVDSTGAVQYRDDLYGLDHRLEDALRRHAAARFVLNPPVEWGTEHRSGRPPSQLRGP